MNWIEDTIASGGIAGVFGLTLLETVLPWIPSEVVMPLAGVAAARGAMPIEGAIAAGIAGSMAGNVLLYLAARGLGVERFEAWVERHGRWLTLDRAAVERARAWVDRSGGWVVGAGRCLPAVRSIISIPAGLVEMRLLPFLLWSSLGTSVWTGTLTYAGYRLGGAGLPMIDRWLGPLSTAIVGVAILVYLFRLATWRRGMSRGAAVKLVLAAVLLGVAAWLYLRPRTIDEARADALAKAAAVRFTSASGEPVVHFGRARRLAWPDGWEFVWTYRPCPDAASLRVFVPLSGRGVRVTEEPDCTAAGFGDPPVKV